MKVACISPHRPELTSIATHAIQFVRCLRDRVEINLFSDPAALYSLASVSALDLLPVITRNIEPGRVFPGVKEAVAACDVAHFHWGNYDGHAFQYPLCRDLVSLPNGPAIVSSIHDVDLACMLGGPPQLWRELMPRRRKAAAQKIYYGDIPEHLARTLLNQILLWSDAVIVHSQFAKQMLIEKIPAELRDKPLEVIKVARDTRTYVLQASEIDKWRIQWDLNRSMVFGYIGRLHPAKGIGALVEACHLLREFYGFSDFILLMAGSGPEMPYLQHMCAKLLPSNHRIVGFADWPVHHVCDLLVIARAIVRGESSGVFPEGYASGRPVIAPDMGSFREYLNDQLGYLMRGNTVLDYLEAIKFFVDHPEEVRKRGEAARAYASKELDFRAQADTYLRVYEAALASRRKS